MTTSQPPAHSRRFRSSFDSSEDHAPPCRTPLVEPMAAQDPVGYDDYEALPPNMSVMENCAAGAFAGIAEHSVMYPVDMLKTRLQILRPAQGGLYTGLWNAARTVTNVEGSARMWKGVSSVIIGAGPAHALYFLTLENVKHAMGGNEQGHHPLAGLVSGGTATIVSDAVMNPFDVVKQRMQVHGSPHNSIWQCLSSVYRNEGIRAFYISYPTTITMTVPFTALQVMAYGAINQYLNPQREYNTNTHIVAGGLAGGFAAAVTTPLDVVKTMLQTRGSAQDKELREVKGIKEAVRIINGQSGLPGFFRGLQPRVYTAVPSTAICWGAYELVKQYFVQKRDDS